MLREAALDRLENVPRTTLGVGVTPLVGVPHVRAAVGDSTPELLVKMDAWTGFALGGNKVRKLEYELGPDQIDGVTHLVTMGGPQSNHCRVTAAVAAHLGLACTLVINGVAPEPFRGNALIQRMFGAEIQTVPDRPARLPGMHDAAERIRSKGGIPRIVPLGASTPRGSLGYARAMVELAGQLESLPKPRGSTTLVLPSSSGGTLAGVLLGLALTGSEIDTIAVSADDPAGEVLETAMGLARGGKRLIGFDGALSSQRLTVTDEFVGSGYGVPTSASNESAALMARKAGMLLDPFYTAKAFAAALHWIRQGRVGREDRLVFLHTGGQPSLFA